MTALRICFVGDAILRGVDDTVHLGWPERLCTGARKDGHRVTLCNLAVRRQTTAEIARRWRAECEARLAFDVPGALIFAFGANDMACDPGTLFRASPARSEITARKIIEEAAAWKPVLWIGPAPVAARITVEAAAHGLGPDYHNKRLRMLAPAYGSIAEDLGVPFLDLYAALAADRRWARSLEAGDGVYPDGDGYGLIAEIIGQWPAWRSWLA
ncbi:MAG: GDSL family lipase [Proteobacteria bacterium]|nr:GDSL family lipase [Pseudomonadota bacterium]